MHEHDIAERAHKNGYEAARAEIERLKEELDGEITKNMRLTHEIQRIIEEYEKLGKRRDKNSQKM